MVERSTIAGDSKRNMSPWTAAMFVGASSLLYAFMLSTYLSRLLSARRRWMAARPFPFNATTVAMLLAATARTPSDVTGAPPDLFDHLLRLSGILLFCITVNLSLSSLGAPDGPPILDGVMNLGVNFSVQLYGLYTSRASKATPFAVEQKLFSAVMAVLLAIFLSHSLTVATVRRRLESDFRVAQTRIAPGMNRPRCRGGPEYSGFSFQDLKAMHSQYWVMAITANPDWALRSWGTHLVCAVLTWGVVGAGLAWRVSSLLVHRAWREGRWAYAQQRFSAAVFLTHVVCAAVGGVTTFAQGLHSNPVLATFTRPCSSLELPAIFRALRAVSRYRVEVFEEWRAAPLLIPPRTKLARKLLRGARLAVVDCIELLHLGVIFFCNLVLTLSALVAFALIRLLSRCGLRWSSTTRCSEDLRAFNLRLGLDEHEMLVDRRWMEYPERWIRQGSRNIPANLVRLLESHCAFRSPHEVYNRHVPSIFGEGEPQPPHSWTLTIVTVLEITELNFRRATSEVEELLREMKLAVRQGIKFARLVDLHVGPPEESEGMKEAVEMVAEKLGLGFGSGFLDFLLDMDDLLRHYVPIMLRELEKEEKKGEGPVYAYPDPGPCWIQPPREAAPTTLEEKKGEVEESTPMITKRIAEMARTRAEELVREGPRDGNPRLYAANCMYRVAGSLNRRGKAVQKRPEGGELGRNDLKRFQTVLADTMAACFSRLPLALLSCCSSGAPVGGKEEKVREATLALAEAEELLGFLEKKSSASGRGVWQKTAFQKYEDAWYRDKN